MNASESTSHLFRLAKKLSDDPAYMANVLFIYQQQERLNDESLAGRLSIDASQLPRLALCKRPQPEKFAEQIQQIAVFANVDVALLAQVIRQVEAVQQMQSISKVQEPETSRPMTLPTFGMLAAARDHEKDLDEEQVDNKKTDDNESEH